MFTSVPSRLFRASFHILAAYVGCTLVHIDMTEITCMQHPCEVQSSTNISDNLEKYKGYKLMTYERRNEQKLG